MIHVHPLVVELRFFDSVDLSQPLHKLDKPYRGIVTATIDDTGRARLSGLHCGDFSVADFNDISATLKELGAKEMHYRHHARDYRYNLVDNTIITDHSNNY